MGTSRSVAEFVGKIADAGVELDTQKEAKVKVGLAGKTIFSTAKRVKGIRGTTKVSRNVKERFDLLRGGDVLIRYTGPAHLLNSRTRQHAITPKGVKGTRKQRGRRAFQGAFVRDEFAGFGSSSKKGSRAIVLPGGIGPKAYAIHPGTKGLRFMPVARKKSEQVLPGVYMKAGVTEPLRKVFR